MSNNGHAKWRVLLVDDHARLRELYRAALHDDDRLQVVGEASDGALAVQVAREVRPDLVVLDLSMPNVDGLQALQDLKVEVPDARVAVVSGFVRERIESVVLQLGANAYFEKGVPATSLADLFVRVAEEAPRRPGPPISRSELERRVHELV